jgi:hypothetical protein
MSDTSGSSLLTAPPVAADGNPPQAPQLNAAQQALADAQESNEIPEWVPEKFWDKTTKAPKTEELGRSYKNLEKLLGREKVPVPTSDDDEEGWQRWYAAMGRPEAPDKYEFKRPDLPTDLPYDEDSEKAFREWAHINGLNKKQANNLYDAYVKTQVERHASWHTGQQQSKAKIVADLQREYGNQYEGKVNLAKTAIRQYADPDFLHYLDESGMGNDPRMIRAWIKVGEKMTGETKLKGAPVQEVVPADLERAISDFRGKFKEALFNKDHPDHDIRVKDYNKLFEARYGDK